MPKQLFLGVGSGAGADWEVPYRVGSEFSQFAKDAGEAVGQPVNVLNCEFEID